MTQQLSIEDVFLFYRNKKEEHSRILQKLKKRFYHVGTVRLLLILGMMITIWFCRNAGLPVLIGIIACFLLVFLVFVVYHSKLHAKRVYEEGIVDLCENELKALDYDFSAFDGATEQVDTHHSFSLDLDLFGENSLFQSANRTVTQMGRATFIQWFLKPLDRKEAIVERQNSIREISDMHAFRHDFYVTGKAVSTENKDVRQLFSEHDLNARELSGNVFYQILIYVVPAIFAILITGLIFNILSPSAILINFIVSFFVTNLPAKQIRKLYVAVDKTDAILKTYSVLMEQIENEKFHTTMLRTYRQKLFNKKTSASSAIRTLSRYIGSLNQRYSLMGILLNLIYMRDTRQAMKIEKWKKNHAHQVKDWFDTLGLFDVFCSAGAYLFNHPSYIFPTIEDTYFELKGNALGHPLIHRDKCVCNDVAIPQSSYFLIITGAKMARKSTYLRTVGVNFLFACMGFPVFADALTVSPAHLVTSLRTADSLTSNESYFFAELKRLKMIIDRLEAGEPLFIILDEILKGTNSFDKQKGSFALVRQLIEKNTCGIIATHDLLLGTLSETFPENIRNQRFEADITNDMLTFTYQIQEGVAQNMNATHLMKKMGIFHESS
jgi:DNA mismatch repair ATPase MutS